MFYATRRNLNATERAPATCESSPAKGRKRTRAGDCEHDAKITALQDRVKALETKKQEILAPKPPRKPRKTKKQKIQDIVQQAVKSGMSVEDVASKLQVQIAE